jgi:hypothetical protein
LSFVPLVLYASEGGVAALVDAYLGFALAEEVAGLGSGVGVHEEELVVHLGFEGLLGGHFVMVLLPRPVRQGSWLSELRRWKVAGHSVAVERTRRAR